MTLIFLTPLPGFLILLSLQSLYFNKPVSTFFDFFLHENYDGAVYHRQRHELCPNTLATPQYRVLCHSSEVLG